MATTSVHVPADLLEALDEAARERGVSRNRLIVEACRREVRRRREWPEGFFDDERLDPEDLAELRNAGDLADGILEARRSRREAPLR